MRFINLKDREQVAVLALNREEALQVVHDLINQLAGTPGAGSTAKIVHFEDEPGRTHRLTFMLDDAK